MGVVKTKSIVGLHSPADDERTQNFKCEYFEDEREGTDRWGRPYAKLIGCGPSIEEACPAYLEESCAGCRNPGDRIEPCRNNVCGGGCGVCGGGGRVTTIAMCGQRKSVFRDTAWYEMGGSLRLERWTAKPTSHGLPPLACNWFPVVESNRSDTAGKGSGGNDLAESWMAELGGWPMIATTMKTPFEGLYARDRVPLRRRIGIDDKTPLILNGLVLDDMLDEIWDDREHFMECMLEDGVNVFIPAQLSAYPQDQNWMALYNANRIMKWHCEAVEMGFEHVGLQHPGAQAKWLLQEYYDFAHRSEVKLVSISLQTVSTWMGGFGPGDMLDLKLAHENYPKDAAFYVFGPSTQRLVAQVANVLKGRKVVFATVNAYSLAIFFNLFPQMTKAPAGWSKAKVFRHNCEQYRMTTDKVLARQGR